MTLIDKKAKEKEKTLLHTIQSLILIKIYIFKNRIKKIEMLQNIEICLYIGIKEKNEIFFKSYKNQLIKFKNLFSLITLLFNDINFVKIK